MATERFGFVFGFPTADVFTDQTVKSVQLYLIELTFERETVVRTAVDGSSDRRRFEIVESRCGEEHSALTLHQPGRKEIIQKSQFPGAGNDTSV